MHPLRVKLHNELHARPSVYFSEPAHVYHVAFLGNEAKCTEVLSCFFTDGFCESAVQGISPFEEGTLKWERHAEFFSLTLVVPRSSKGKLWVDPPKRFLGLINPFKNLIINLVHIDVTSDHSASLESYGFNDPSGSIVGGGDAVIWGDFRLSENGENRFLLVNKGLNAYRLGRMVRRLLEIETYRMMASLSLEDARALSPALDSFDQKLLQLSRRNTNGDVGARSLLDDIAQLSKQVVDAGVKHRHRFSATQAYAKLVFERLQELRESHAPGYQRLGIFIERRFKPTLRFCIVTEQRLDQLAKSVANLGDLLQARVQVDMEDQNARILQSLNTRADAQVKIQRAVEGLSVIGISYYLLSLCKLFYSGLETLGLPISAREALIWMAPLVIFLLAFILFRIKKAKEH